MDDAFHFGRRGMLAWFAVVAAISLVIATVFHASSWFIGVGVALAVVGVVAHSLRTGEWVFYGRLPSRPTWFEGWVFCTGIILVVVPLLTDYLRQLVH